jgi:hypothetical protein
MIYIKEDLDKRNNAITAFMGGPKYLKEKHFSDLMDEEFELIGLEDLRFHKSWDWLIPVWSKVRFKLSPMAVIGAITYIDENKIEDLYELLSNTCINWCKENNIKL